NEFGNLLDEIGVERNLLIRFLAGFARAEFTLKQAGLLGGYGNGAASNCDGLAAALRRAWKQDRTAELGGAVESLDSGPPQVEVLTGGEVGFLPRKRS